MARSSRTAVLLAGALAAWLLCAPLVPAPQTVTQFRVLAYGSHLIWYLTLAAFVVAFAHRATWSMRRLLILLGVSFVLAMGANILDLDVVSDLLKIVFGATAGLAFVRVIERPWWLVPICVCVPLADAWSVFSERGVTHAIVERARDQPAWIDWPTIATPLAGYDYAQFGRLGTVDVLFLALFLGAAVRWRMGSWRGVIACTIGLLATSVLVLEGVDVAIPALPLLCIAFLIVYAPQLWRDMRADLRRNRT